MKLIKVPTLNGDVWVNPAHVIWVVPTRLYRNSMHVGDGAEIRTGLGGFRGAEVNTTLSVEDAVKLLTA